MIIPIRCFSCGKVPPHDLPPAQTPLINDTQVVGDLWESYLEKLDSGMADVYALPALCQPSVQISTRCPPTY